MTTLKAQVTESTKEIRTTDINEAAVFLTDERLRLHDTLTKITRSKGRTRVQMEFIFRGPDPEQVRQEFRHREIELDAFKLLYNLRMLKAISHNKLDEEDPETLHTTDINEAAILMTSGAARFEGLVVREDSSPRGSRKQTVFVFRSKNMPALRMRYANHELMLDGHNLLHNLGLLKTLSHKKLKPEDRLPKD